MLVDGFTNTGTIEDVTPGDVTTMPGTPTIGTIVYLTQTDGSYAPGLYAYNGTDWTAIFEE